MAPCSGLTRLRAAALLAPLAAALAWGPPAAAPRARCPVPLLSVSGDAELVLEPAGLAYLESFAKHRRGLYLASIAGASRTGKSMLMNRCMGRRAPYSDGFGVGHQDQTYTRGVHMCVEEVLGLGLVVWLDTEGLFSPEEAHGRYGPKLFSFQLLSQVVMLSFFRSLTDQFFEFFGEQQATVAKLRAELEGQRVKTTLLPEKPTIFWIVQQPVRYNPTSGTADAALRNYLQVPGELRSRIKAGFQHIAHEVPTATADSKQLVKLDQLEDEDLSPDYLRAVEQLRHQVLKALNSTKPLHVEVAIQALKGLVLLVNGHTFGESFQQAEMQAEAQRICTAFHDEVVEQLGGKPLEARALARLFKDRATAVEEHVMSTRRDRWFTEVFDSFVERCIEDRKKDLINANKEIVSRVWQSHLDTADPQSSSPFFLGSLTTRWTELSERYGEAFDGAALWRRAEDRQAAKLQHLKLGDLVYLILHTFWPSLVACGLFLCQDPACRGLILLVTASACCWLPPWMLEQLAGLLSALLSGLLSLLLSGKVCVPDSLRMPAVKLLMLCSTHPWVSAIVQMVVAFWCSRCCGRLVAWSCGLLRRGGAAEAAEAAEADKAAEAAEAAAAPAAATEAEAAAAAEEAKAAAAEGGAAALRRRPSGSRESLAEPAPEPSSPVRAAPMPWNMAQGVVLRDD